MWPPGEHGVVASQFELLRYLRDHPRSRVADIATNFAAGIGAISKGVAEAERTFHEHLDALLGPAISADQIDAAGATLAALRRALELARVGVPVG